MPLDLLPHSYTALTPTQLNQLYLHQLTFQPINCIRFAELINGVEDTEHFLLHCHSYDACRTDLLDSVNSTLQPFDLPNLSNALMLKLILYGDERLSVDSNSEILKATLRYIYATQRFE